MEKEFRFDHGKLSGKTLREVKNEYDLNFIIKLAKNPAYEKYSSIFIKFIKDCQETHNTDIVEVIDKPTNFNFTSLENFLWQNEIFVTVGVNNRKCSMAKLVALYAVHNNIELNGDLLYDTASKLLKHFKNICADNSINLFVNFKEDTEGHRALVGGVYPVKHKKLDGDKDKKVKELFYLIDLTDFYNEEVKPLEAKYGLG